ncbi:MAG: signal recognition particle-docking protein FtsY [Firmicutes bacterium]|nr:signal recognition particle-docking protein FtsY [Bacillota bacterium]
MGLFDRFKETLSKTRQTFTSRLGAALRRRKIDEDVYEELEDALLSADVGLETTTRLLEAVQKEARRQRLETADQLTPLLREAVVSELGEDACAFALDDGLTVILVVGVNGAGKTTTIGKLAHRFRGQGKKVLVAAGDTFRAAAIEQLQVWADRAGVDVVRQSQGSDPAAVIYDALQAAKARGVQVLLCDTAGRLQNKAHLMAELEKLKRVIAREVPGAPHEVLLVLDATTGQNALSQAQLFRDSAEVTGIALTKLDSTAKGGFVIAIRHELGIPVKWVATGETIEDLQPFSAQEYAQALFADV